MVHRIMTIISATVHRTATKSGGSHRPIIVLVMLPMHEPLLGYLGDPLLDGFPIGTLGCTMPNQLGDESKFVACGAVDAEEHQLSSTEAGSEDSASSRSASPAHVPPHYFYSESSASTVADSTEDVAFRPFCSLGFSRRIAGLSNASALVGDLKSELAMINVLPTALELAPNDEPSATKSTQKAQLSRPCASNARRLVEYQPHLRLSTRSRRPEPSHPALLSTACTPCSAGCRASRVLCDRGLPCLRCVRLGRECVEPGSVPRGRPSRERLAERARAAIDRKRIHKRARLVDIDALATCDPFGQVA